MPAMSPRCEPGIRCVLHDIAWQEWSAHASRRTASGSQPRSVGCNLSARSFGLRSSLYPAVLTRHRRILQAVPALQSRQPSLAKCAPGILAVISAPCAGSRSAQPHHVSSRSKSRLRRELIESRLPALWLPRSQVERKPPRQHSRERWRSAARASRMPTLLGRTRPIKPRLRRFKTLQAGDSCGQIDVLPFWIEAGRLQLVRSTEKFIDKAHNTMKARRAGAPVACYDCHRNPIQSKNLHPERIIIPSWVLMTRSVAHFPVK